MADRALLDYIERTQTVMDRIAQSSEILNISMAKCAEALSNHSVESRKDHTTILKFMLPLIGFLVMAVVALVGVKLIWPTLP